jgi:hypothetical protein
MGDTIGALDILKFCFKATVEGAKGKLVGTVSQDGLEPINVQEKMASMKHFSAARLRQELASTNSLINQWNFFLKPGKLSPKMHKEGTAYVKSFYALRGELLHRIKSLEPGCCLEKEFAAVDKYTSRKS